MKRHKFYYLGLTSLFVVLAGCATIVSGSTQTITVSSNVDGATVFLEGERIGVTPFTGIVKKNKKILRVEAPGYRTEEVALSKNLDPIFWGNIITGGTLGSITDFASGAAYQYAPASYQVVLQAEGQSSATYQRELGVRKFAMIYIDQIAGNISEGGGAYVDALITLSGTQEGGHLSMPQIVDALEKSRGDQVRFGNYLVDQN